MFLRVCLMGQLRYSDMKIPAFPVAVDLTTRFERVSLVQQPVYVEGWWVCGSRDSHVIGPLQIFTNCRDPSLIQEVLRGELHMRVSACIEAV